MNKQLQLAREKGFIFDGAKAFITEDAMPSIVNDAAAMLTAPTAGVPAVLTAYVDPKVIDILLAPTNAREIFGEAKMGDWTTDTAVFKTVEEVGETTPYSDYGNGATADVNVNFPTRQNYIYQTHIRYGERERAVMSRALIDLASQKQIAAANIINRDANKFYLYGVAGKEIYGLLNEPNLPAAITPGNVGGATLWSAKDSIAIYNDVLALAGELFANSQGRITADSDLVLVVPPAVNVRLGTASQYNVSVKDMLEKYFTNIKFVVLPELATTSGNNVMLVARRIDGLPTAQLAFSEKMRALPLVQNTSSWEQKFVAGTYGCVLMRPFGVAVMAGV